LNRAVRVLLTDLLAQATRRFRSNGASGYTVPLFYTLEDLWAAWRHHGIPPRQGQSYADINPYLHEAFRVFDAARAQADDNTPPPTVSVSDAKRASPEAVENIKAQQRAMFIEKVKEQANGAGTHPNNPRGGR